MINKNSTDLDMEKPGAFSAIQPIVSIVMPVFNEEFLLPEAIPQLYEALISQEISCEILICENGSTDSTLTEACELADKFDRINVLTSNKADYGAAIRSGILAAKAPYVFVFDIDYYDVGFLERALTLLKRYDIVIASKLAPGADDKRSALRRMITRGFSLTIKTLFNTSISETHGMKAFRREAVEPVMKRTRSGKDLFDTELIIRAERAGLRITEIPVTVEEKRPTRSSILKRIPRTITGLVSLRYVLWREGSS
jgi:glycosyltransferase involved in cell wall biosynthesis